MQLERFAPVVLLCLCSFAAAQKTDQTYSRRNTFSGFAEFSNDSSHIILGQAANRKIGAIGFQYQRRLIHRQFLDIAYTAEIRPGMLESDPTVITTDVQLAPVSQVFTNPFGRAVVHPCRISRSPNYSYVSNGVTYTYYEQFTCGRRTVIEQGFSPAGVRISLMPHHRLQPTFSALAGYMFSTQAVPTIMEGSFNYTFEFGAGLEFYRSRTRSLRIEYQVQHYSNNDTANSNPGVDSGFVKFTYAFGR